MFWKKQAVATGKTTTFHESSVNEVKVGEDLKKVLPKPATVVPAEQQRIVSEQKTAMAAAVPIRQPAQAPRQEMRTFAPLPAQSETASGNYVSHGIKSFY